MAQIFAQPFYTAISAAGNVVSGAKLYFYATGTTTPQTTYQDDTLATPHTNPVVADSAGRFPAIYLDPTKIYRAKLTESNDALIKDVDPVSVNVGLADISFLAAGAGARPRTALSKMQEVVSILDYGTLAEIAADAAPALTRALATSTGQILVSFPPGKFQFLSAVSYTLPNPATGAQQTNAFASVSLVGSGQDVTTLYWASTDGLIFTYRSQQHSVHIRDMTITTGAAGGKVGLTLTNTYNYFGTFVAQSDLTNVTFRGDDGYALTKWWEKCVSIAYVSDVTFNNVNFYGNTGGLQGTGVYLDSPGAGTFVPTTPFKNYFTCGTVYDFVNCNWSFVGLGLFYGNNIQTAQIANSFFAQCNIGISCPAGVYNNSNQGLIVNGTTFFTQTSALVVNSPLNNIEFINNFVGVGPASYGVFIQPGVNFTITGNQFLPRTNPNDAAGGIGIQGLATGTVQSIDMTNCGTGYVAGATVTPSGGGGAGLALTIGSVDPATGAILTLNISNRGAGYSSAPSLSFPAGSGATARVNLAGTNLGVIDNNTFSSVTNGIILDTQSRGVVVGAGNAFTPGLTNNVLNAGTGNAVISNDTSGLRQRTPYGVGYGSGAGGVVVQATNKATAVTLNKPVGKITTNNASLAANTGVSFTMNSSLMAAEDLVIVTVTNGNYTVRAVDQANGSFTINLVNITGGPLTDAVVISFAIIKGAVA